MSCYTYRHTVRSSSDTMAGPSVSPVASLSSPQPPLVGFSSGALGPLPGPGGEHVAVAGALVHAAAAAAPSRGHAVALLAAEPAGPHARARPRAPHAALARAEPCMRG